MKTKKANGVSLETILERRLQYQEIRFGFDQRHTPIFDRVFKVLKALGYRMEILALPEKRRRVAA
jgi:hypothetical protein